MQGLERLSREVLEALPAAIYTTDAEGRITFYNQAAADLAGRTPELGSDQWCVSWRLYKTDGTPLAHHECPMARCIKEQRSVRGTEIIAERPDGSRVHLVPHPTPLFDLDGRLTGAVNMLVDVTERNQSDVAAAQLAAIVTSSDDAIISKTLDGRITSWNEGATRIFGYDAGEMIGEQINRIIPPEQWCEEEGILARLKKGERIEHFETVRLTRDGRRIDISLTVSPVRDRSGRLIGASKVGRDITERKYSEKLQQLLIGELNHRVKNTLATVQSIANQTVHLARSPSEFASGFSGRLQALAQAHTLLTQSSWQGADVQALIRDQLLLGGEEDDRISCSGPSATLDPQAALHLALLLHELGTNARKYGALSMPSGRLSVEWTVRTNGGRNLLLQWKERGGPTVTAPAMRGFGTTLIEQTLDAHGGAASISYEAHGVTCDIRLTLQDGARCGPNAAFLQGGTAPSSFDRPAVRSNIRGKRVLVVEDEPLVAMDVVSNLTGAGCNVVGPAATVDKARTLIEEARFDVVLLDANLGGYPVDELAAVLTQGNIPFAFLTGYGRESLPQGFRDAPVISKPFAPHQLLEGVASLLVRSENVVSFRQKGS